MNPTKDLKEEISKLIMEYFNKTGAKIVDIEIKWLVTLSDPETSFVSIRTET